MINGAIELYSPAHIPCNILANNKNYTFFMNNINPAKNAILFTINRHYL